MEAKDTRINELRLWSILEDEKDQPDASIIMVLKKVRDEQVEISFKAGYEAKEGEFEVAQVALSEVYDNGRKVGIREVVGRLENTPFIPKVHDYEYYVNEVGHQESKHDPNCKLCQWRQLKKEWGIKDG